MSAAGQRNSAISVLVVDDHPLVRMALRRMLEEETGLVVVGSAANGAEAVALTRELRPRVVVMDLSMPVMDGVEATRQIVRLAPQTAVLMISMSSDERSRRTALEAGAQGYLEKNAAGFDLAGAVRAVAMGEHVAGAVPG
jgi:DNA-binding NarL/FixJ family response regulator